MDNKKNLGFFLIIIFTISNFAVISNAEPYVGNGNIAVFSGGRDQVIDIAYEQIENNIDQRYYENIDDLSKSNSFKSLIIIAHGDENGVIINNEEIAWNVFGLELSKFDVKEILLLACNGKYLEPYLSERQELISFTGIIDTQLSGLLGALYISSVKKMSYSFKKGLYNKMINHFESLESGESQMKSLYSRFKGDVAYTYPMGSWGPKFITSGIVTFDFSPSSAGNFQIILIAAGFLASFLNAGLSLVVAIFAYIIGTTRDNRCDNHLQFSIYASKAHWYSILLNVGWLILNNENDGCGLNYVTIIDVKDYLVDTTIFLALKELDSNMNWVYF